MRTAFQIIFAALIIMAGQSAGFATSTDTLFCTGDIIAIGDTARERL